MPRTLAVELAEALDLRERDRRRIRDLPVGADLFHSRQVQQGIEEHGRVPVGKNKAVAIRPDRILWIITQDALPQGISHGGQRHRRSWMAGIGLLYCIHGQSANGVDGELIDIARRWDIVGAVGNVGYWKLHGFPQLLLGLERGPSQ